VAARTQQRSPAERTRGDVILMLVLQPSLYALSVEHVVAVHQLPNLVLHAQLAQAHRTCLLRLRQPLLNLSERRQHKSVVVLLLTTCFCGWGLIGFCSSSVVHHSEDQAQDPSQNRNHQSYLVYGLAYCQA